MNELLRPPGLGFAMLLDGTVTSVSGESAAYADLVPGAVILESGRFYDPQRYIDITIRQDGETKLVHLYLGVAGPAAFGCTAPPLQCPEKFHALWGDRWRSKAVWRHDPWRDMVASVKAASGRQPQPSPKELARQRAAAWTEVRRLKREALATHPDRGGDKAKFQRLWPRYQRALQEFRIRWPATN
jgi:hypothetical protein